MCSEVILKKAALNETVFCEFYNPQKEVSFQVENVFHSTLIVSILLNVFFLNPEMNFKTSFRGSVVADQNIGFQ